MATQDIMTKTTGNAPIPGKTSQAERRGSRRCKINQLMRIRPSDPEKEHFEELRETLVVPRRSSKCSFSGSEGRMRIN